jgi:hypothetical protein
MRVNPERVPLNQTLSGFERNLFDVAPGFSLRSNPGLGLANAFGVISQTASLPIPAAFRFAMDGPLV